MEQALSSGGIQISGSAADPHRGAAGAMPIRQPLTGAEAFGFLEAEPVLRSTGSHSSSQSDRPYATSLYCGYPVEQLVDNCSFLEVAYLMLFGDLPTAAELAGWVDKVAHNTLLDECTKRFLDGFRHDAHPAGMFVGTLAALSTAYPEARNIADPDIRMLQICRLLGKLPTIAAYTYRHSIGLPYVYPDVDAPYIENFTKMLWRTTQPKYAGNPALARALERLFIVHAQHDRSNSGAVMKAVSSTHSDPFLAASAAVAALSGPLQRGQPEQVLRMIAEIGGTAGVPAYMAAVRAGSRSLPGFGDRVYAENDPRNRILRSIVDEVLAVTGTSPATDVALELERFALNDGYFIIRKLFPNGDFYSAVLCHALSIAPEMFTPIFAIPRAVEWLAIWDETVSEGQRTNSRHRRPREGELRDWIPVERRGVLAAAAGS